MTDNPALEDFLQKLRELFAAEFARGEQAAIQRIMQAAGHPVMQAAHPGEPTRNRHDTKREVRRRVFVRTSGRAPRGSVDALINRVLSERGTEGASAAEILESAKTQVEKLASYSGIRFALDRGRDKGRYRNKDGRWYLVASAGSGSRP
jgi:hypothetical protein